MTLDYDLQVHTDASPCSAMTPERLVDAALEAGLDGVAVTDHDTAEGARRVEEAAPPSLDVIPAVEVSTTQGHLLAFGVREPPPPGDPLDVVDEVHARGGLAVLSHPFDPLREHYSEELDALAEAVDGVEVANSRCLRETYNRRARAFARRHDLAVTGGSDAHFPHEVGRAATLAPDDLVSDLSEGRTRVRGGGRHVSGHVRTKVHEITSLVTG